MDIKRIGPFEVLESKSVYRNPWIAVREDKVIRPDGKAGVFGVVQMKPGSSVLAINDANEVLLVREFKYGVERETLEVISGALDEHESPLDAAKRELREEVGLEAAEWIELGLVDPFTTVIQSPNYMFLARGLSSVERSPDEGEVLEAVKVSFECAIDMAMRSEITHSASCVLLLKAARYLAFPEQGR